MSHAHHHANATGDIPQAVRERIPASGDPTQTKVLRRKLRQRYNAAWRTIRGDIRAVIDDSDALALRDRTDSTARTTQLDIDPSGSGSGTQIRVPSLASTDDATRQEALKDWLRDAMTARVLRGVEPAPHLRDAYVRGLGLAVADAKAAGVIESDAEQYDPTETFTSNRHQSALGKLRVQTATDVEAAINATLTDALRETGTLLAADETARQLADTLTERVDAVGQTRTAMTANTRVVDTVNRAILEQAESMGATRIGAVPEAGERRTEEYQDDREAAYATAGDNRVCAICRSLAGRTATVEEIKRGDVPTPPTHPNCRCRWVVLG